MSVDRKMLGGDHYVTTRPMVGTPHTSYRIHRMSDDEIIGAQITEPDESAIAYYEALNRRREADRKVRARAAEFAQKPRSGRRRATPSAEEGSA